jgi:hypothetical protein
MTFSKVSRGQPWFNDSLSNIKLARKSDGEMSSTGGGPITCETVGTFCFL